MPRPNQRPNRQHGNLISDLLKGAIAGAAAVWVMDRVDWFAYTHEDPEARHRTKAARPGGMDPAHVMANRAASMYGTKLSPSQPHPAGIAFHYGLGIGPGALYGAVRHRMEGLGPARGPLYGLGLFLAQDEVLNAITGLSARPRQYPWQAHVRGLAAHLVYGLVTDTVLNVLDAAERSIRHRYGEQARFEPVEQAAARGAGPGYAAEERFMKKDPNLYPSYHRPQASDTQTLAHPV